MSTDLDTLGQAIVANSAGAIAVVTFASPASAPNP